MGVFARAERDYQLRSHLPTTRGLATLYHVSPFKKFIFVSLLIVAVITLFLVLEQRAATPVPATNQTSQHVSSPVSTPANPTTTDQTQLNAASDNSSTPSSETSSSSSSNNSSTQVTVNGQNIPVPQNGSVNQTLSAAGGQGKVNVQINSQNSNTSTGSHSSTNVQVFSNSNGSSASNSSDTEVHL